MKGFGLRHLIGALIVVILFAAIVYDIVSGEHKAPALVDRTKVDK